MMVSWIRVMISATVEHTYGSWSSPHAPGAAPNLIPFSMTRVSIDSLIQRFHTYCSSSSLGVAVSTFSVVDHQQIDRLIGCANITRKLHTMMLAVQYSVPPVW